MKLSDDVKDFYLSVMEKSGLDVWEQLQVKGWESYLCTCYLCVNDLIRQQTHIRWNAAASAASPCTTSPLVPIKAPAAPPPLSSPRGKVCGLGASRAWEKTSRGCPCEVTMETDHRGQTKGGRKKERKKNSFKCQLFLETKKKRSSFSAPSLTRTSRERNKFSIRSPKHSI